MASDRQENPVLFHLNSEIYKNGLKFDRDRTFRNKLIVKTIVLMAVLLIIATVTCVSMAKSADSKAIYNETQYIQIQTKVPVYYNQDSLESNKREVSEELDKTFKPPREAMSSDGTSANLRTTKETINNINFYKNIETDKARKRRGLNSFIGFRSEISENSGPTNKGIDPKIEVVRFQSSKKTSQEKSDALGMNGQEMQKEVSQDHLPEQLNMTKEKKNRLHNIRKVSEFWKGGQDEWSLRHSQAKRMLSYMDLMADPCDDFYQYACGNWNKNNPIPQDKAGYDIFELLRESLDTVLQGLLTEPSDNNTSKAAIKAKDFYESCMNEDILEKRGNKPLLALSKSLKGWPVIDEEWNSSDFNWLDLVARLKLFNNDIFITQWIGPDMKNSSGYVIQFDQTRLGLPSRDYFLKQSNSAYVEAYKKYLIKIAVLLGANRDRAKTDAEEIIRFETELAQITLTVEARRNMTELYSKMTLSELSYAIPQIDWAKYLNVVFGRNFDANESMVTYALKYFKALVQLIEKTDERVICNYLMWRFMRQIVNALDRKFQDAKQEFYLVLFGREKSPLRWSYCVSQVNANMGMALGSIFVQRYFDESSKNDTITMTQDVMHTFREMLNSSEWIDEETKALALNKINAMTLRIGYPDYILDEKELDRRYGTVNISKLCYFENILNILQHTTKIEQEKLGKVVNRTLWNTAPTIVNAYYSRNINQIMVPAGILQPPFYHKHFPKALNYGGIGVAIGHEISHGFDDKGRLFDQNGTYQKWWKEETLINFHRRVQCLIDQYSSYTVSEIDMNVDGVNTQGENIADNGGIRQAFRAYEKWFSQNNSSDETMPGINVTNFQLFFLNFAQIWCGGMRPQASRNKLKTAIHPPGRFRVIGTLSNSEEFARVFRCPSNRTMNPPKKCSLW